MNCKAAWQSLGSKESLKVWEELLHSSQVSKNTWRLLWVVLTSRARNCSQTGWRPMLTSSFIIVFSIDTAHFEHPWNSRWIYILFTIPWTHQLSFHHCNYLLYFFFCLPVHYILLRGKNLHLLQYFSAFCQMPRAPEQTSFLIMKMCLNFAICCAFSPRLFHQTAERETHRERETERDRQRDQDREKWRGLFSGLKSTTRSEKRVITPYQKFQHRSSDAERGRGEAEKFCT